MVKIICISGKAQHGKDTTASFLKSILENYNKKVLIIHNADLLKYMCKQLFGWSGRKDEEGRRLLQYIGTDVVREREPSFWVDYIIKIAKMFEDNWDYILVPDCRFPNEIVRFVESGFVTYHIRVNRGDFDNGLTNEQKNHQSETAIDNIVPDYILHNCSDIDHLSRSVASMVNLNNQMFNIDNR